MKRTVIFFVTMSLVFFCSCSIVLAYSGGDGSVANPYQIDSPADWQELTALSSDWILHFVLTSDIDLTGVSVDPVGDYNLKPFSGSLDGNGFVIKNITITPDPYGYSFGLFEYVGSNGKISNLGLVDIDVSGIGIGSLVEYNFGTISHCYAVGNVNGSGGLVARNSGAISYCYVIGNIRGNGLVGSNSGAISHCYTVVDGSVGGGLVGYNTGTITFCSATANVSGNDYAGGLVRYNEEGTIRYCYASGSVVGTNVAGGLVGSNFLGVIDCCYATNDVRGGKEVGGLVGINSGMVTSCYATGAVDGGEWVGGLIGWNIDWNSEKTVGSCYATGDVSGSSQVGGLVGRLGGGKFIHCYSTGKTTGTSNVGGLCGFHDTRFVYEDTGNFWDIEASEIVASVIGEGKTTAQMQDINTFLDSGWDFSGDDGDSADWQMLPDDYPCLAWRVLGPVDLTGDGTVDHDDLMILANQWLLAPGEPSADIAPYLTGDGIVDMADFALLASYWITGQ